MVGLNDPDLISGTASKKSDPTFEKLSEDSDEIELVPTPGPSSRGTHVIIAGTNGDAQKQQCESSEVTSKPKPSKDSGNQVIFNGTVGEIIQVFDFNVPSDEAALRKKYTTLQPFLKTSTIGLSRAPGSAENLVNSETERMSADELKDKELHDKVVKTGQLVTFQEVVQKLVEVEGYNDESWGSAVEISEPTFYPKKLTSAMSQEEFELFINTDNDVLTQESKIQETGLPNAQAEEHDNTVHHDLIHLPHCSHTRAEENKFKCSNGDKKHAIDVANGEEECFDQCAMPSMDPKQPQSSKDCLDYLNKAIDISDEEITSNFVLDLFLRDVAKPDTESTALVAADTSGRKDITEPPTNDDDLLMEDNIHNSSQSEEKLITTTSSLISNNDEQNDLDVISEISPLIISNESLSTPSHVISNDKISDSPEEPEAQTVDLEIDCHNHSVEKPQISPTNATESNLDPDFPDTFSIPDPRISRRTRSPIPDCNSSQVSVTSTSSSHSSIRACSVRLVRLSLSPSPSRSYQSSVEDKSSVEILRPTASAVNVVDVSEPVVEKVNESDEPMVPTHSSDSADGVIATEEDVDEDDLPLATIKTKLKAAKEMENKKTRRAGKRNVRIISVSSKSDDSLAAVPQDVANTEEEKSVQIFKPIPVKVPRISQKVKMEIKTEPDGDNSTCSVFSRKRLANVNSYVSEVAAKKEKIEETAKQDEDPVSKMSKKRLINFIKQESKKDEPDFVRLSEAMSRTYEQRRKPVYDKGRVFLEDLKSFPELLHYQMVKEEYGRIKEDLTKMKALEAEFISGGILTAALEPVRKKTFKKEKKHKICEDALKLWQDKKPDAQYHKVLGILTVCFSFAENNLFKTLCKVLKKGQSLSESEIELMQAPTIVVREDDILNAEKKSEIWIYVDGAKFLCVPNIYEAVLTTFATYYLLNIDYPKGLKSLFEFFDMLNGNSQSTYNKTKKIFSLSE